jgi:hypothetical protein
MNNGGNPNEYERNRLYQPKLLLIIIFISETYINNTGFFLLLFVYTIFAILEIILS